MKVTSVVSNSLGPCGQKPTRLLCPWNFPGKNTGAGCYFLLQGIFLTQGSKLCLLPLLHWQADSLLLCHLGNPYAYIYVCTYVSVHVYICIHVYTHRCIFLLFVIPFRKVHSYFKSFLVPCFPTLHCDLSVMM